MVKLCCLVSVFLLFCKNFLQLCLDLFCLGLLIRDTNYGSVRSFLFLIFIISSLIILNFLLSSVLFHFSPSVMCCVCLFPAGFAFLKVLLPRCHLFDEGYKFSFQLLLQVPPADARFASSGCASAHVQSLVALGLLSAGFIKRVLWACGRFPISLHLPVALLPSSLPPFSSLGLHSAQAHFPSWWLVLLTGGEHHYGVTQASWFFWDVPGFCTENPMFQDTLNPGQTGKVGQPGVE